jgi:predicted MFS family arabinose efflux permease
MASNVAQGSTQLILIGAAVLLSIGMGLRQSLGLFLTPVTRDLALTAADFTLTIAIQNIVWGLSQAPVGAIADRFGLRITLVAGTMLYVAGLVVMAAAGAEAALIVSSVLIGVALSCTASSLALAACARAVPEQSRSKMLGVVAAAGSLGTLIVPLATQGVLKYYPWQIGAIFFAILAAAMLPAALWASAADKLPVMTEAAKTTMRDTVAQALRHRGFLVMSGAYFVCGLNLVFLTTHLPAYLEICGQDPMLSAEALAVIGAVNCVGALLAGWLGGRYPKHVVLGWLYILRAVAFACYFMGPPTAANTLIFAAVMGLLWFPGVWPLLSGLVAEMFGTRYMATLLGLSFVMHQVGSSLGAWGGGIILDLTGSYGDAWKIGVVVGLAAGIVQILAGGPARPREARGEPQLVST